MLCMRSPYVYEKQLQIFFLAYTKMNHVYAHSKSAKFYKQEIGRILFRATSFDKAFKNRVCLSKMRDVEKWINRDSLTNCILSQDTSVKKCFIHPQVKAYMPVPVVKLRKMVGSRQQAYDVRLDPNPGRTDHSRPRDMGIVLLLGRSDHFSTGIIDLSLHNFFELVLVKMFTTSYPVFRVRF
jgi:hypothetical protein